MRTPEAVGTLRWLAEQGVTFELSVFLAEQDDPAVTAAFWAGYRAARVLDHSGPVPWDRKHDVLQAVATVPELAPAVLQALLGGYHDSYGDLEPDAALALLNGLDLPPDTEHLAPLRAVLAAGVRKHRHDRDLWDRVQPG